MVIPTATLSAEPSADRLGAILTVAPSWPCWPQSDKSRGFGGRAPIWEKGYLPFEKTLTNGGESWSAAIGLGDAIRRRLSDQHRDDERSDTGALVDHPVVNARENILYIPSTTTGSNEVDRASA